MDVLESALLTNKTHSYKGLHEEHGTFRASKQQSLAELPSVGWEEGLVSTLGVQLESCQCTG